MGLGVLIALTDSFFFVISQLFQFLNIPFLILLSIFLLLVGLCA